MFNICLEETWLDYPTPDGNAIAIIMTGCEHHCPGCHSPNLQKEDTYSDTPEQIVEKIKKFATRADTNKLILIGGDPLYTSNLPYTHFIVQKLAQEYDICLYTGYDIDFVKSLNLGKIKYYKCGKFLKDFSRKSEKTDSCFILASPNQNFYDENFNLISNNGILNF